MADAIVLRGLRVTGVHGALPEEQTRAQPFEIDLEIACDLREAGRTDLLDATLDYGEVIHSVAAVVANEHHQLLERLAERIAEVVRSWPIVTSVTVEVRKTRPPVPVQLESAGVRITRP